jgi:hypothetical protein
MTKTAKPATPKAPLPSKKPAKSKVWQTKYGARRVKEALPDVEEALFAAKGLSDDFNEQIELAAQLLGVPLDVVRTEAMKSKHTTTLQVRSPVGERGGLSRTAGATRSVVVERRVVRRAIARPAGV